MIYNEVPLEEEVVELPPAKKSKSSEKSAFIGPSPFKNAPIQKKVNMLQSVVESPREDDFALHFLPMGSTSTQN